MTKPMTQYERYMSQPRLPNTQLPSVRKLFGLDLSDAEYKQHLKLTLVEIDNGVFKYENLQPVRRKDMSAAERREHDQRLQKARRKEKKAQPIQRFEHQEINQE